MMARPKTEVAQIRQALADYMKAEGCSCCRNEGEHAEAAARLAKLLRVPKYQDGSGYNFARFQSGRNEERQ
jgi:methionine aminopeptidase